MTTQSNGVYDTTKPWQSNEERLAGHALSAAALGADTDDIRSIRPPIPRVGFLPPRFGYGERRALGIGDLVDLDLIYPGARVDYSGNQSGYQGTSFPSLGVM